MNFPLSAHVHLLLRNVLPANPQKTLSLRSRHSPILFSVALASNRHPKPSTTSLYRFSSSPLGSGIEIRRNTIAMPSLLTSSFNPASVQIRTVGPNDVWAGRE